MQRRRFLELATISSSLLAGCGGGSESNSPNETQFGTQTEVRTTKKSQTKSKTSTYTVTQTRASAQIALKTIEAPAKITVNQNTTIRVQVENIGDKQGSTTLLLEIGGLVLFRDVTLEPGVSKWMKFKINDSTGFPITGSQTVSVEDTTTGNTLEGSEIQVERRFPDTIFVGPDGSDSNSGTDEEPLGTIQEGMNRAQPGETVYVKSGEYFQSFSSERHGKHDAPITVTGPPDAVVKGIGMEAKEYDVWGIFRILHHHIHLTGLTFDGLWDPSSPDDPESYRRSLVRSEGAANKTGSEYLEGVKIAPYAVGNSRFDQVHLTMTNQAEVGPFRVIGPAGAFYTVGDAIDHRGEIVYIGTPPITFKKGNMPIEGPDESHAIHVHHIDNSAGHPHSELVNTKSGTHDIIIEYCTDGGAAYDTDDSSNASIAVQGHDTIVRWNDLQGGDEPSSAKGVTRGIKIDADVPYFCEREEGPQQCVGFNNSIYGNRIRGFSGLAVGFEAYLKQSIGQEVPPNVWPEDQKILCGNEYSGETHGDPDKTCPDSVPTGDGIGYLGGDSPWSGDGD